MNIQLLLIFQLIADIVLFISILFLLLLITKEIRRRPPVVDPDHISDFKKLLASSQEAAGHLLKVMDESRKSLKEVAFALDEREARLKALVEKADKRLEKGKETACGPEDALAATQYDEVLKMARSGLTPKEISERSGLAEGEIDLIIDLDRKKNEIR